MHILDRIDEIYPKLTRKQKLIADYMRANANSMTFVTLKGLSKELGITEITVLNMCRALGYDSFNDVKYEFRKYINENRTELYRDNDYYAAEVPEYELEEKDKVLAGIAQEEMSLIRDLTGRLDTQELRRIAGMFTEADNIILSGRGVSYLLCEYLGSSLSVARIPSVKVNTELNESVYSALPSIKEGTLVVACSFPDHYFMTQRFAEYARKQHAKVLVITDSEKNDIAFFADELLTVASTARLALNTLSAPMALMNLLASAVTLEAGDSRDMTTDEFSSLF